MPRHFMQTEDLAGVGIPAMHKIFEDLAANVGQNITAVVAGLLSGFPQALITSVMSAVTQRAGLLADAGTDKANN